MVQQKRKAFTLRYLIAVRVTQSPYMHIMLGYPLTVVSDVVRMS